jgi:threonine dehydrogenase-like Zn-dependent dehydrogenase
MNAPPATMRSLICLEPGKLEYREIPAPKHQNGQAIIKVRRIGVCGTDLHAFEGTQPYFSYPRVLGHELSGELLDPGNAPGFSAGDLVTILPYFNCGHCGACLEGKTNCCQNLKVCGVHQDGGMVDFLQVPASSLVSGQGLGLELLALVEPLAIGAHAIGRSGIRSEDFLLVVGAGPIGLGAMEFARIAGARVIAMDIHPGRLAFCRDQLKAPYCFNPRLGDGIEYLQEITGGKMPKVVIDATGSLGSMENSFSYMSQGGSYILLGLHKGNISFSHPDFHRREGTLMSSRNATRGDFEFVIGTLNNSRIRAEGYISEMVPFESAAQGFPRWLDPAGGTIKAMISMDDSIPLK